MSLKQGMREIDKVERIVISEAGLRANINNYVKRVTGRQSLKAFIWQEFIFAFFGNLPTAVGSVLGAAAYRSLLGKIGSNCFIEEGVRFRIPQRVFLGDRVFIEKGCDIDVEYPESEIRIGQDVWLGSSVIVLRGVTVHDGAVVGPVAVVTKNIPSYSIAGGVPTKVIGKRE